MAEGHTSHTTFHIVYGIIIVVLVVGLAGVVYHYHKEMALLRTQPSGKAPMMRMGERGGSMGGMMMAVATPAPLTAEQQQQISAGPDTTSTQKTFTIDGGNFYFSPNKITVNTGDTVTINFKNDGGVHDFVIDAFKVKSDVISTGKTESFTFTADKAGTYQFYCSIPGHKAKGMVGTLVVQ